MKKWGKEKEIEGKRSKKRFAKWRTAIFSTGGDEKCVINLRVFVCVYVYFGVCVHYRIQ